MPALVRSVGIALLICVVVYVGAALALRGYEKISAVTPASLFDCFATTTDPTFASKCLHTTVSTLLSQMSTRQVQTYTVASSSPRTILDQCHPIGHILGEETYKKAGVLETALSMCSNDCRAACLHGVLGAGVLATLGENYPDEDIAHADDATIEKIGSQYCAKSTSLCHGIGHILYILNGEGSKSFSLCDRVSTGFAREACYQGVYMEKAGEEVGTKENLFPFQTIPRRDPSDDPLYPCSGVAAKHSHACFQFLFEFQKPRLDTLESVGMRVLAAKQTCESLSGRDRAYCFEGIGIQTDIFGGVTSNVASLESICRGMKEYNERASCTLGVIPRFLFLRQSGFGYCYAIAEESRKTLCYQGTFQWLSGMYGTNISETRMCGLYPECTARYREYRSASSSLPDYRFGLFGKIQTP